MKTILLLTLVALLMIAGCTQNQEQQGGDTQQNDGGNFGGPQGQDNGHNQGVPPIGASRQFNRGAQLQNLPNYSLEEVAGHNTTDDCWVLMNGTIYNFSNANLASDPADREENITITCGGGMQGGFGIFGGGNFNRRNQTADGSGYGGYRGDASGQQRGMGNGAQGGAGGNPTRPMPIGRLENQPANAN